MTSTQAFIMTLGNEAASAQAAANRQDFTPAQRAYWSRIAANRFDTLIAVLNNTTTGYKNQPDNQQASA